MARILCVDDEPSAVALKQSILERAGHDVRVSSTANDAIRMLESERFDAVVTDWKLGEESGRQILLAAKRRADVPVVVVSGYCTDAFRAAEPQADIYLEKPVDPTELVAIVEALLRTGEGHANKSSRSRV